MNAQRNGFFACVVYLAVIGIISFLIGRILPKQWFHHDRFPYALYPFEKDGRLYEKLRIRSWQKRLPDMSRIFPKLMPPKSFDMHKMHRLPEMIRETCVAELIHELLCIAGLHCISLWKDGGAAVAVLNILGNLPFVITQRYNRPRFVRMMNRTEKENRLCES